MVSLERFVSPLFQVITSTLILVSCLQARTGFSAPPANEASPSIARGEGVQELYDLQMCFRAAVQKSELLIDQKEQIFQSNEALNQAWGSFLPNVSGSAVFIGQQAPTDPVAASFYPTYQPTIKLTATQPIFRGFREFGTIRQLRNLKQMREFSRHQSLIQLYSDVVTNYYELLALEKELANLDGQIALYEDRITELGRRARTGESSASDGLSAQAAQAGVRAQARRIQGQYKTARENFVFLTGLPRETPLAGADRSGNGKLVSNVSLETFLGSLEQRPDIQAAKQAVEATDEGIVNARSGHLPSIDVVANYYLLRPRGIFDGIKWDVQGTINVPIFSGGIVKAQVSEAASKKKQAEVSLSRTRRKADQEVRSLYETYLTDLDEVKALDLAMQLAEKNYLVLKKDYSRGLTRNIDVLTALAQFQESKRALDRSRFTAHSDWIRLNVLSSYQELPEMDQLLNR